MAKRKKPAERITVRLKVGSRIYPTTRSNLKHAIDAATRLARVLGKDVEVQERLRTGWVTTHMPSPVSWMSE